MPATNFSKSGGALLLAGSVELPRFCAIGSGSGAFAATGSALYAEVLSERRLFTTRDISVANKVTQAFDYGSITMSGITLREVALCGSQNKNGGQQWLRDHFTGVEFDGTNELQVEIEWEVF